MRCLALGSSQFSLWGGLGWPGRWARRVGVAVQVLPPEVGVARSVPGQGVGVAVHALPPEVGVARSVPAYGSQPPRQDPSNPKGNLEVARTSRMPHPSLVVLSVLPSSI